jgi:hypothetical protein
MPIRADLRHFYGREWRTVTRPRILARAGNRCEQCRVPNHSQVTRVAGWWVKLPGSLWRDDAGRWQYGSEIPAGQLRRVRIVLTIAHLNHTAGDNRGENLKALCQYHHLQLDAFHHHLTRAARKDAARPLLNQEASA